MTTDAPKHTPLPWHSQPDEYTPHIGIKAAYGYWVATMQTHNQEANSEFIVRAVNSFDALLAACIQADLQIEYMQSKFKETGTGNAVRSQLQAAIKEAEKCSTDA